MALQSPNTANLASRISNSSMITPLASGLSTRIGVSKITAEIQDEFEHLKEAFKQVDENGDFELDFDEVYNFLNRKSIDTTGQEFDRAICESLFKKLDRNQDQKVTIDEIILSYCDQKKAIEGRINAIRTEMGQMHMELENVKKNMIKEKARLATNEYGISTESILTVHVVGAKNLLPRDFGHSSDPYVQLTCEKQVSSTQVIRGDLNPQWNEVFSFKIQTGQDPLQAVVLDEDQLRSDQFEGKVDIPLETLRDQMKHDFLYDLKGKDPTKKWQGRLHLNLQWIYNKAQYFEEIANQWQASIDGKEHEIQNQYEELKKLKEPFGMISTVNESMFKQSIAEDPGEGPGVAIKELAQMMAKFDFVSHDINDNLSQHLMGGQPVPWGKTAYVAMYIFLICSALSMFFRPDFMNLTLAVACLYYHMSKTHSEYSYRMITTWFVLSLIFDIIWLLLCTYDWEKGNGSPEDHIRRLIVFVSLINFLVKLPNVIIFWRAALEEQRKSIPGPH